MSGNPGNADDIRWGYFEGFLRISVVLLIAVELPDDDCLVTRGREDHIWIFRRRCQGRDPAIVA